MKIKAIIIEGELPESCNQCPYAIYDNDSDGYICMAKMISEYDNLINDINIRQSWCPLVTKEYVKSFSDDSWLESIR